MLLCIFFFSEAIEDCVERRGGCRVNEYFERDNSVRILLLGAVDLELEKYFVVRSGAKGDGASALRDALLIQLMLRAVFSMK